MTGISEPGHAQGVVPWRRLAWGTAAVALLAPLVAMQFTDEVDWSPADFVVFGVLLAAVGTAFELALRLTADVAYRTATAVALAAAFLLVWINGAVGMIGDSGNAANLLYAGVPAVALAGAMLARFQPAGMVRALVAAALAQVLVTGAALALVEAHERADIAPFEVLVPNGAFVAMFLAAAWLYRIAARRGSAEGAGGSP